MFEKLEEAKKKEKEELKEEKTEGKLTLIPI
jgi:hypothetical protein